MICPRLRRALLALVPLACACGAASVEPSPSPDGWTEVWHDEFEGPASARVDSTRWRYDLGDGCQVHLCGWGNGEREYYSDASDNVALDGDGHLIITARRAAPGLSCYYGPCLYTSGKITTRETMTAAPGRVEARIKLSRGQGLWSAFWMLGEGHPLVPWPACGELDVMENKGSQASTTSSAVHGPGYSGATPFARAHTLTHGALSDDFHIFAVEWDSLQVRFFVDDSVHYSTTRAEIERFGASVLGKRYYVILNLAVGGTFDGDPRSDAIFPARMSVDYVRVYRPKSAP